MKKSLLVLSAFILMAGSSCQKKIDIEKEKATIIKVLNDEGRIFAAGDMQGLSAIHVRSEMDARLAGTTLYKGWSEIEKLLSDNIENNKKNTSMTNPRNLKENIVLKVTGNTAWLTCDNIWKWEENNEQKDFSNRQISFFEKINGEWKFSFNAFVQLHSAE